MTLDPLAAPGNAPALAGLVAQRLRDMITHGTLAPGERLKETELAASMEVSRGPVREAIAILEADGLVEVRRHRGARVIEMTPDDLEEVYSLRLALERLAMERAASRISTDTLQAMDTVLGQMRTLPEDHGPEAAVALDLAFHDLVYEAADHHRLTRSWHLIRSQVAMFLYSRNVANADFRTIAHAEHTALRDVLAAGDIVEAGRVIEEHLSGALQRLLAAHVVDSEHEQ